MGKLETDFITITLNNGSGKFFIEDIPNTPSRGWL